MARLKKFVAYRKLERPYTRKSKYKSKNFVRGSPPSRIVRYTFGNPKKDYDYELNLRSKDDLQIRSNAIEAARQTCTRVLEKTAGKDNCFLMIRIYPHHIMRENPLATGAGADRMSTGMKRSFGKPIGVAAQVRKGQILATVKINSSHLKNGQLALKRFTYKLPCSTRIEVISAPKIVV